MARGFYGRVGMFLTDDLTDNLVNLGSIVRTQVREAVLLSAGIVQEKAHDLANVSPGALGNAVDGHHMRDCIDIVLAEDETSVQATIGIDISNVPYAPHQEFGPHGKPFLRPAFDESRQECHEIMRSVLIDGVEPHTLVRFRRFA